ncbi:glycosyltransferase (plasmid) [Sphingomonas sp. CJ20]
MADKIVLYYNDLVFSPSDSFLSRDFGQVPYVLSEKHGLGLEYWISAVHPNPAFPTFRDKMVRQFSKALRWLPQRFDFLKNLRLYLAISKDDTLSHLVLFPFTPLTDLIVARLAKRRRKHTRVILKLDANAQFLGAIEADWTKHSGRWYRRLRQSYYYRELLRIADLVICETTICEKMLRAGFLGLDLDNKLAKTFSGVSEQWLTSLGVREANDAERKPAIIVSGRLSIWVKYTSLIFEAGPPPPGWTIEFVGDIDEALQRTIDRHRESNPLFDEQYRFHGVITDKKAYYDILMRSRALLMNSRGPEGFPNVYADAQFCRLFLLSSDIASAADATADGRWGIVYAREDATALRAALDLLPERVATIERDPAYETYRRSFIWEHSLDQPVINRLFDGSPS